MCHMILKSHNKQHSYGLGKHCFARPPSRSPTFINLITIFFLWKTCLKTAANFGLDIIRKNIQSMFHDDLDEKVPLRVFTRFYCCHNFQWKGAILKSQDILRTNYLSKFHAYWTNNAASCMFTRFHSIHIRKNIPSPKRPCFSMEQNHF